RHVPRATVVVLLTKSQVVELLSRRTLGCGVSTPYAPPVLVEDRRLLHIAIDHDTAVVERERRCHLRRLPRHHRLGHEPNDPLRPPPVVTGTHRIPKEHLHERRTGEA